MTSREDIRVRLTLHYDGSAFHGWQVQPSERTVQGEVHTALQRLIGQPRSVTGSGRTDRGVHAIGQVVSVRVPVSWTAAALRKSLNAVLPRDIWVEQASEVSDDFHPRRDAVLRTYEYRVGFDDRAFSPFRRRWCWALGTPVPLEALNEAASLVPKTRSFRSFAKAGQPHLGEICEVRAAHWEPWEDLGARFTISANRFLHHMIRYLVGTMIDVGRGRRPLADLETLLGPDDTDLVTSRPAPAQGLYLSRVDYREVTQDTALDAAGHPLNTALT